MQTFLEKSIILVIISRSCFGFRRTDPATAKKYAEEDAGKGEKLKLGEDFLEGLTVSLFQSSQNHSSRDRPNEVACHEVMGAVDQVVGSALAFGHQKNIQRCVIVDVVILLPARHAKKAPVKWYSAQVP